MSVVPHKPLSKPLRDNLLTISSLLQVTINEIVSPENGGASILSYHLRYDDSSKGETWTDLFGLATDEIVLSHGVTDSIQPGEIYQFQYRAKNVHGWGPFSDSLYLIAASVPDVTDPVVTSNEGLSIRISWKEPGYDGGRPLHGFQILIKQKNGQFSE